VGQRVNRGPRGPPSSPFPFPLLFAIVLLMKVILVQPPIEDFYDTRIRTYPLGLLYLAARIGTTAEVKVLDGRTGYKPTRLRGHEFQELMPFYREKTSTPFSFFSRYCRFGAPVREIGRIIEDEKADVTAIASMCSAYEEQALEVAREAKRINPQMVTVMGGSHPTLFPERLLCHRDVDYCIRGEGETPIFELVSALSRGRRGGLKDVPGLCFKEGDRLHISGINIERDLDLLPRRELLDGGRYLINGKRYTFFLTSRGCPFSCSFCGRPPLPYRKRGLDAVEEEIDVCLGLGIEAIDFEDDMLNLDKEFFTSVLRLFLGKGLSLSAMNGIYPTNMDVPTLELMGAAGFRRLNFSLVATSDALLETHERHPQRAFLQLLPFLEGSRFLVEVHFIIGLPGQHPADLVESLCFLMGRRLLLGPSIFYLSPGSPLSRTADWAARVPLPWMRSSLMLPANPLFPRTVTYTFVKLVRFINYVKQVLDSRGGATTASDLLDCKAAPRDGRGQAIIERLLREKRLLYYDRERDAFCEEPVDRDLLRAFFEKARGRAIRGYRTDNSLIMDV